MIATEHASRIIRVIVRSFPALDVAVNQAAPGILNAAHKARPEALADALFAVAASGSFSKGQRQAAKAVIYLIGRGDELNHPKYQIGRDSIAFVAEENRYHLDADAMAAWNRWASMPGLDLDELAIIQDLEA